METDPLCCLQSEQETYEGSFYMTLVTDKVKHNMIQQMLVVVNQDKFMMQRAIFHSEQETY